VVLADFMDTINLNGEHTKVTNIESYRDFLVRHTKQGSRNKNKGNKNGSKNGILQGYLAFNNSERSRFVTHPVLGKLFSMLFFTFLEMYLQSMKLGFKSMACQDILHILNNIINPD
jgi:hypothetical protein